MNYIIKFLTTLLFVVGFALLTTAKENIGNPDGQVDSSSSQDVEFRDDCVASESSDTDLDINNVRARLLGGGDLWWDLTDGRYIIPNVPAGEREVSSIFAAALWIGGIDAAENLKVAAQTYRQDGDDFWPGPIGPDGTTDQLTCLDWDEHFKVLGKDIDNLVADFLKDDNGDGEPDEIVDMDPAESILKWPARGNSNPTIANILPPNQDMAPFYDEDNDGLYNPYKGDIPIIGVVGCDANSLDDAVYADQMVWWVYNDVGNIHTATNGDQIGMEIQALAFAFETNNDIDNMSFYKYTLLNKATIELKDTYIGQWVDPDLGCWNDDYVGCIVDESLGIVYNGDSQDDFSCAQGVNGYGDEIPMLGVDYFRGPKDTSGMELGMSSFVYYNNDNSPNGNPDGFVEIYNYLSGFWRDGTPIEFGGDGYNEGTFPTPYMFPDDPTSTAGDAWSECSVGNDPADRRFLQTSGPFILSPGATNEVIIGAVWVPNITYPCPSFDKLLAADRVAQALFDNCFDLLDGPDAPDVNITELDRELIITLTNEQSSNNYLELYSEQDVTIPLEFTDTTYIFQGYVLYQLAAPTVPCQDLNDCEEARIVAVVDIQDGVGTIVNHEPFDETGADNLFVPTIKVEGDDSGILHSFNITNDLFATGDSRLINHRKYYYRAIAYAYNNYAEFDPSDDKTQRLPFLQGRRNIKTYTAIPHNVAPEDGTVVNAAYGDGPEITRIDGEGAGGYFLEIKQEDIDAIVANNQLDNFTYEKGKAPIEVKVYDPLLLKPDTYTFKLNDTLPDDGILKAPLVWELTTGSGEVIVSEKLIDSKYEQLLPEYGISITLGQTDEVFEGLKTKNGFIGATVEYADPEVTDWYNALGDDSFGFLSNYIKTSSDEADEDKDPARVYSRVLDGLWSPFYLTTSEPSTAGDFFITPRPSNSSNINSQFETSNNAKRNALPNVDIVLTSDKSKWSRCIVVNTFSEFHGPNGVGQLPADDDAYFKVRQSQSVGKDGEPDGTGTGMSWFPGYAVNVETGERLYMFFGENTFYGGPLLPLPDTKGNDMIWNPSTFFALTDTPTSFAEFSFGEQHNIYVTTLKYDSDDDIQDLIDGINSTSNIINARAWSNVGWVSVAPIPAIELNSVADGIIPGDVSFKLRVDNPFRVTNDPTTENGYPTYQFTIDDEGRPTTGDAEVAEQALGDIRAVPNPYYGYSPYESTSFEQVVKITNLPPKCKLSIYSLDGRLIRTYNRNAQPTPARGSDQVVTSQDWDLKNEQGINVATGVYIIHIDASASGLGEKVIKWFGGVREFDATGL